MSATAGLEAQLRPIPLFQGISDELLHAHVLTGGIVGLRVGEHLVEQGEPSKGLDVLLDGGVEFVSLAGGRRVHVLSFVPPAIWGHEPLMADVPVPVTGVALEDTTLYRLLPDAFWALVGACPQVLRRLVRTVAERFQTLGANTEQQMRLVSLGTMAAGLAHELNNPAAAARSSAAELGGTLVRLRRLALDLAGLDLTAGERELLARTTEAVAGGAPPDGEGALARADREEELAVWLDAAGVEDLELAPALADHGVARPAVEPLLERLGAQRGATALSFVAASAAGGALTREVTDAGTRISGLVTAMRDYSRMDEAPEQEVDLAEGLEAALAVLAPKLGREVTVERRYDPALPPVPGSPGELNQVWANLIDNALDAMGARGRLLLETARRDDRAVVAVTDDGPGIPPEALERVFDAFFTMKPPGAGVGLGLDVVRRIVDGRHHGEVRVRSVPGATRFEVLLPLG